MEGMKRRKDRTNILKLTKIPFLQILGKKDNYIPFEIITSKLKVPLRTNRIILENSGHMGFFEEKEKAFDVVIKFAKGLEL